MSTAWLKQLIDNNDRLGFAQALDNRMLKGFAAGNVANDGNLLHAVIRAGWEEMVLPLIGAGADVHARDARGDTPLHLAGEAKMPAATQILIEHGADINARAGAPDSALPPRGWGDTPLHRAIEGGNVFCLMLLLSAGADPKIKTPPQGHGMNAWHRAAQSDNPALIDALLAHPDHAHMNDTCEMGKTHADAFRLALHAGHAATVQRLIDHGVNINGRDTEGHTPLHWLLMHRKTRAEALPMVRLLLRHGADGDKAANLWGETPLMVSAKADFPEAMRLLLDKGADVTRRSNYHETALHFAAHHYTVDTINVLLDAGADVNAVDRIGQTPLHIAAHHNRRDVVKTLLARGADPLVRDKRGRTPDMICQSPVQEFTRAMVLKAQDEWRKGVRPVLENGRLRRKFARAGKRGGQNNLRRPYIKKPPSNDGGYQP